jgi:hypothetical protein
MAHRPFGGELVFGRVRIDWSGRTTGPNYDRDDNQEKGD